MILTMILIVLSFLTASKFSFIISETLFYGSIFIFAIAFNSIFKDSMNEKLISEKDNELNNGEKLISRNDEEIDSKNKKYERQKEQKVLLKDVICGIVSDIENGHLILQ